MSRMFAVLAVGLTCIGGPALAAGPYHAPLPEAFVGEVVGEGHCVHFVQTAARVPRTAEWRPGAKVRGNPGIAPGTAIANPVCGFQPVRS